MRNICKLAISLMVMYMLICPVIALENQPIKEPVTYRVIIDQNYGFYRIYEIHDKISSEATYAENGELNISKGDTVILINGAVSDNMLTIISEEHLWNDDEVILKYSGKEFSYTFYNSGIYNIYIKEHPLLKQRIIVGPIDVVVNTTDTESIVTNDTVLDQTNITGPNGSDTGLDQTNMTETNNAVQNSAITDTNVLVQNSTNTTERKSVQISILGKSSAFVRTAILLVVLTASAIFFLSVRIKDK